jgi:starch phosphorylase
VKYEAQITPNKPGIYKYSIRMFPKHLDLAHRQDFPYVKWL